MSGGLPGGLPLPAEVVNAARQQAKQELELETTRSSILYQKAWQKWMRASEPEPVKVGETEETKATTSVSTDEFTTKVKQMYLDAYSLRAFKEIMEGKDEDKNKEIQQLPSTNIAASLIKSGVSPEDANKWLSSLTPQALGALLALQTGNPQLAQMSFAMGQRSDGLTIKDIIELNQALGRSPNMNIDFVKLLEVVKQQPQGMTSKELMDLFLSGVQFAQGQQPQRQSEPREKEVGVLENLLKTPEGARTAKELGLIGNDTGTLAIIAEMRKNDLLARKAEKDSDRNWDLRLEELKMRREIASQKIQGDRERTDLMIHGLQKIGEAVAGAFMGGEAELPDSSLASKPGQPQAFECEVCKSPIVIPAGTKLGAEVECGKCHTKYNTQV